MSLKRNSNDIIHIDDLHDLLMEHTALRESTELVQRIAETCLEKEMALLTLSGVVLHDDDINELQQRWDFS